MTPPALDLLLASRSPRRAELLRTLGVAFEPVDVEIDESPLPAEAPTRYVTRLASGKARAGFVHHAARGLALLAADTTVVLDGELLGKPADAADACAMLARLAGRAHDVLTGVALIDGRGGLLSTVVSTRVIFRPLTTGEIAAYVATGEPADKAGSYGIQGLGGALVSRIEGSYSNVVGLPLAETLVLLGTAGVPHALSGV